MLLCASGGVRECSSARSKFALGIGACAARLARTGLDKNMRAKVKLHQICTVST